MSLSPEEARVLGCLLEKERTTPDAYPLSLNTLVSACNQSTNRSPVVQYREDTVEAALDELRERSFVRRGVYPGSRVIKYRHVLDEALGIGPPEMALLCVLLLRGPQTPGELKSRTERLHPFTDLVGVDDALDRLSGRDEPLARRLPREPGQKEARVRELLTEEGGEVMARVPDDAPVEWRSEPAAGAPPVAQSPDDGLAERVAALEAELAALRTELEALATASVGRFTAVEYLVYHNPSCGKSRGALDILREQGIETDVVEYLKAPPDRATLERIVDAIPNPPGELVRKDKRFKELGLVAADYTTRDAVVELLLAHPELMERPVVFRGERAVIARPSETVLELVAGT